MLEDRAFIKHILSCKRDSNENGNENCKECNVKDLCDFVSSKNNRFYLGGNNENNNKNKTGGCNVMKQNKDINVEKLLSMLTEQDKAELEESVSQIYISIAKITVMIAKHCFEENGND